MHNAPKFDSTGHKHFFLPACRMPYWPSGSAVQVAVQIPVGRQRFALPLVQHSLATGQAKSVYASLNSILVYYTCIIYHLNCKISFIQIQKRELRKV